jgi:small subunit ribosomal protein S16
MLTIRLQRTGKKHQPQYRLVVAEKRRSVSKLVHEILGHYSPITKVLVVKDPARVTYYTSLHTDMSDTVRSLLKRNNLFTETSAQPAIKKTKKTNEKKTVA